MAQFLHQRGRIHAGFTMAVGGVMYRILSGANGTPTVVTSVAGAALQD